MPSSAHHTGIDAFFTNVCCLQNKLPHCFSQFISHRDTFQNTLFLRVKGLLRLPISFISLTFPDPLIPIVNAYCVIERAYLNWLPCYLLWLISFFVLSIVRWPAPMEWGSIIEDHVIQTLARISSQSFGNDWAVEKSSKDHYVWECR